MEELVANLQQIKLRATEFLKDRVLLKFTDHGIKHCERMLGIFKSLNITLNPIEVKEGTLSWQFPGGKVENGETEQDAVIREVKEETNLKISVSHKIGDRIHPITKKYISYWLCNYISGEIFVDDEDIGEAKWVDGRDVMDYFTTPLFEPVQKILFGK